MPVDRDALVDELHETFRKTTWTPPRKLVAPAPPPVYSRWRSGPRSFGLRGKLAITIASVGLTLLGYLFAGLTVLPLVFAAAWLIRETWTRERIR